MTLSKFENHNSCLAHNLDLNGLKDCAPLVVEDLGHVSLTQPNQ